MITMPALPLLSYCCRPLVTSDQGGQLKGNQGNQVDQKESGQDA